MSNEKVCTCIGPGLSYDRSRRIKEAKSKILICPMQNHEKGTRCIKQVQPGLLQYGLLLTEAGKRTLAKTNE
jgi:hypothetical protein